MTTTNINETTNLENIELTAARINAHAAEEPTDAARDAPEVFACDCCGAEHTADELTETADGKQVCKECLNWCYTQCNHCGKWTLTEDLKPVYNDNENQTLAGFWCPDCVEDDAHECVCCGQYFSDIYIDSVFSQAHGRWVDICMSCADERYVVCEECGELVDINYATCADDTWYCETCAPDADSEYVHAYGHTYASKFLTAPGEDASRDDVPFLGIELETDAGDDMDGIAKFLHDAFCGAADLKQDTSIGDSGIEIAVQPQSPRFALTSCLWPDVLKELSSMGATSHDAGTCGLHVHIDRRFLHAPHMACTLDRLFQSHEKEWRVFSRRTWGQIDTWTKFGGVGDAPGLTPKQKREAWDKEKRRYDRYQVVNLSNTDTIEIRLWRGTLRERTFRATIEATAALAYLAHDLSETEAEDVELWTWHSLTLHMVNALKKYRLPYSDLLEYLHERGL